MIFFAVVLSLAALTAAEPENKVLQEQPIIHEEKQPIQLEQQQTTKYNAIPFYKQVYPFSSKVYDGYPKDITNFFGFSQKYEGRNYPPYPYYEKNYMPYPYYEKNYMPYPHYEKNYMPNPHYEKNYMPNPYYEKNCMPYLYFEKNYMSHPHRNNFYQTYLNRLQPKVYYDKGYANQPLSYTPKYNQYVHKYDDDLEYPYVLPYSPSYYPQYMHHQRYPGFNKYYGKSLDEDYVKPLTTYGKLWDVDYVKNYFGRNLDEGKVVPIRNTYDSEEKPLSYDVQTGVYYKPVISRNLESESVQVTIPVRDLDIEFVNPYTPKDRGVVSTEGIVSRNVDVEDLTYPSDYGYHWTQKHATPGDHNPYGRYWDSDYERISRGKSVKFPGEPLLPITFSVKKPNGIVITPQIVSRNVDLADTTANMRTVEGLNFENDIP